jgi:FMN phosphatase YigB (HAD superfamily)
MTSNKIFWEKSVWFFDIDDTLVDTAGTTKAASEGIKRVFQERYDRATGEKVQSLFVDIFSTMMGGHTSGSGSNPFHDEILSVMEERQSGIKAKYGAIKQWSREFFVWFACQKLGISASREVIYEAADAYWMTLVEKTTVFAHVKDLFSEIQSHNRPIYFLTSSDGRLKIDENGMFVYDPAYSEGLKRERIELLREKGLFFRGVSIGDPEDKPHKDFFEKGIKMAEADLKQPIDLSQAIMLGDSYAADLEMPKTILRFGLVVQFVKGMGERVEVVDEHFIKTGSLLDTIKFIQ